MRRFYIIRRGESRRIQQGTGLQALPPHGTGDRPSVFRRPNVRSYHSLLGPNVRGLLMYDATGHMAVHIMNENRPNFDDKFSHHGAPNNGMRPAINSFMQIEIGCGDTGR